MRLAIILLICVHFLFEFAASQPANANVTYICAKIQNYEQVRILMLRALHIFKQYKIIRLKELMDPPLLAQTYGIVDLVRGWAKTKIEDTRVRNDALRILRRLTAYRIMLYVLDAANLHLIMFEDADVDEQWKNAYSSLKEYLNETNEIAESTMLFEVKRFFSFKIVVSALDHKPFFVLSLGNLNSLRFIGDYSNSSMMSSSTYLRPLPHGPFINHRNEAQILLAAQTQILRFCNQITNNFSISLNHLLNDRTFTIINGFLENIFEESKRQESMRSDYLTLMAINLFQRCMVFLNYEYVRYSCHPARQNITFENDVVLRINNQRLLQLLIGFYTRMTTIVEKDGALDVFNNYIQNRLQLYVGYVVGAMPQRALEVTYDCGERFIQAHYVYE